MYTYIHKKISPYVTVAFEKLVGCILLFVARSLALMFVDCYVYIKLNNNKLLFDHFWP